MFALSAEVCRKTDEFSRPCVVSGLISIMTTTHFHRLSIAEITDAHCQPWQDSMDKARTDLMAQVTRDATSAITKRHADELTEGEKFALAWFARVPMQQRDMREPYTGFKMTTVPCGFYHDGEKWIVTMRAEDER